MGKKEICDVAYSLGRRGDGQSCQYMSPGIPTLHSNKESRGWFGIWKHGAVVGGIGAYYFKYGFLGVGRMAVNMAAYACFLVSVVVMTELIAEISQ